MKKTGLFSGITTAKGICAIVILVIIRELWQIYGWMITERIYLGDLAVSYTSPTIVIIAILHVVLFSRLRLSPKMVKIVKFAAPGAFAVYIINVQYYIWTYVMYNRFQFLTTAALYKMPLVIIGFSLLFVILSVTVDRFRQMLFRAVKVDQFTALIEKKFNAVFDKLVS